MRKYQITNKTPKNQQSMEIEMGKLTLYKKLKEILSNITFKIFLWGINMSQEEYIKSIYKQGKMLGGEKEIL